ncbi:MAG: 5,10-methylenetetrahydrofolate reductase [Chloroflexi bacterium]|nr:MAG: 5,10-methylenetetrahydrofolate reductase [Chloroflexota bacterium]TMF94184.1 MAG: 5,10-methylenetetrahydrofolate reductase [Chloroflexota bacterium]
MKRVTLADLLRTPRYEVLPTDDAADRVLAYVPKDVTITVTASPRRGMPATVHLALRLAQLGYQAVPHLSARLIRDTHELGQILDALRPAGITNVFVVAGDAREPAGMFPDSLSLLAALPPDHGLKEIGVTGYPESHPFIHDDVTIQAMWDKRRLATYIVSNMSFDPTTVTYWLERVRRRGVELPIHIGMAGVADPIRLLKVSTKIGVADAARFLRGHPSWVARMFRPGGYEPGRFVTAMLPAMSSPALRVAGLHVFTFNEIEPTERWRREMLLRVA